MAYDAFKVTDDNKDLLISQLKLSIFEQIQKDKDFQALVKQRNAIVSKCNNQ